MKNATDVELLQALHDPAAELAQRFWARLREADPEGWEEVREALVLGLATFEISYRSFPDPWVAAHVFFPKANRRVRIGELRTSEGPAH